MGRAINYRTSVEKEWMYIEGFKDGLLFLKQLHDLSAGADKS
ncbi:hypothetical protein [Paenibacillus sp. RC67]|nr:hypothetical protein [Paenibacillus sp. RC67]